MKVHGVEDGSASHFHGAKPRAVVKSAVRDMNQAMYGAILHEERPDDLCITN
jgi:hypothetical protein